ncbi:MAG: hypothetical protein ACYSW8_30135, partial [Planctomycetota bacterium]
MIDPAELTTAHGVLEAIARLGLKDRAGRTEKVNQLASELKAEVSEHTYAVSQLFEASGGSSLIEARKVLAECKETLVRCYPPAF